MQLVQTSHVAAQQLEYVNSNVPAHVMKRCHILTAVTISVTLCAVEESGGVRHRKIKRLKVTLPREGSVSTPEFIGSWYQLQFILILIPSRLA